MGWLGRIYSRSAQCNDLLTKLQLWNKVGDLTLGPKSGVIRCFVAVGIFIGSLASVVGPSGFDKNRVWADDGSSTSSTASSLRRLPAVRAGGESESMDSAHSDPEQFYTHESIDVEPICGPPSNYQANFLARTYYLNDQRIQFSGQEATFGVEGILTGAISHRHCGREYGLRGEFHFNQPFDDNILVTTPELVSYRGNYAVDPFDIEQLAFTIRHGDWLLEIGKVITPFGRTYFPLLSNGRFDAPFIRTESILWRETGAVASYRAGWFQLTSAVTNGTLDRDTNSSKALISRIGFDAPTWAVGASIKSQDGIGSESQKVFNNHVGMDAMYRTGRVIVSSELIYDEYGFRKAGFDPNEITWNRSLYFRDQNLAHLKPLTGVGYYVGVVIEGPWGTTSLDYGEFHPKQIGDPRHDTPTRRGVVKHIRSLSPFADIFGMALIENSLPNAQSGRTRQGLNLLFGFQYAR